MAFVPVRRLRRSRAVTVVNSTAVVRHGGEFPRDRRRLPVRSRNVRLFARSTGSTREDRCASSSRQRTRYRFTRSRNCVKCLTKDNDHRPIALWYKPTAINENRISPTLEKASFHECTVGAQVTKKKSFGKKPGSKFAETRVASAYNTLLIRFPSGNGYISQHVNVIRPASVDFFFDFFIKSARVQLPRRLTYFAPRCTIITPLAFA